MVIVWDEPKRAANLERHGLDFARFEAGFDFETCAVVATASSRTGRDRFKLIGLLDGRVVVAAIVSPLGSEALSLISLRPASRGERELYGLP